MVEYEIDESNSNAAVYDSLGEMVPSKVIRAARGNYLIRFLAKSVPSMGYKTFYLKQKKMNDAFENLRIQDTQTIENEFFSIQINNQGHMIRLFDKMKEREVLKEGREANVLQIFEDKPTVMEKDAWMVDTKREDRGFEVPDTVEIQITEDCELYTAVKIVKNYNKSNIEQEILIYKDQPLIEFKNTVNWNEKHKMMRVLFPVEINATKATYDIAYGTIERNTHNSTSYEHARFETPAHKWADLSEGDYGVALINDCKYGYSIVDGEIQLSLLRAPTYPDPEADQGLHTFSYGLYPHSEGWRRADVVQKSHEMNAPMVCKTGELLEMHKSFISVNCKNIIIDCIKKAEDSEDLIVRLYETHNTRALVEISCAFDINEVHECDLLENNASMIPVMDNKIKMKVLPYEIKTLRIKI
jgi:alpha-mannosidase